MALLNRPFLLALALLCSAGAARAEGPSEADRKLSQSLFDHARKLLEAGQVAAACPKFAESHRLDPAGGTLLNLAICHEREGKTGSAWYEFNEALSLALKEGRQDREQIARERLAALEPAISKISVEVAPAARVAGVEVRLDGTLLSPAAWGSPTVVDPGAHGVDVRAPGHEPWTTALSVEGDGTVKHVEVSSLTPARQAERAPPQRQYAEIIVKERSPATYALAVTAAAGVVTFAFAAPLSFYYNIKSKTVCFSEDSPCERDKRSAGETASTLGTVSLVGLGVGAVAGVAALLVPPTMTRKRIQLGADVGPGRWALGLGGSF